MTSSARFELVPSPALAAAILGAHAVAALAAWIALAPLPGAMLAAALLALGAAAAWSRALLLAGGSVRAIEIGAGGAQFELANGARLPAPAASRRYVTRHLVALPMGTGAARRTLLVTADMLGAAQFRRLRIWALWNRLPPDRRKELFQGPGVYGT